MQFPNITYARISYVDKIFTTDNFKAGNWCLQSNIMEFDNIVGTVEVFYSQKSVFGYEGPFLKEERDLINAISEILGRFIERKKKDHEITQRNKEISALFKSSRSILEYNDFQISAKAIFESFADLIGVGAGYVITIPKNSSEHQKIVLNPGNYECNVDPTRSLRLGQLSAEIIRNKRPLYFNNFANTKRAKSLPEGHILLNNLFLFPLMYDGKVEALIGLANKKTDFNEDDIKIANAFSELAIISFKNNQMLESLENSKQKYRHLSDELEEKVHERTKELIESELKYRNMIANLEVGYYNVDMNNVIIYHNSAFNKVIGYDPSENLIGLYMPEFWSNVKDKKEFLKELLENQNISDFRTHIKTKKGREVTVEMNSRLVKDEDGNNIHIEGTLTDITNKFLFEQGLKKQNIKLNEINEFRIDLLRRTSHELKTPLISIKGFTHLLLKDLKNFETDQIKQYLKEISTGSDRLERIIKTLLDTSKYESSHGQLNKSKENLSSLVEKCVEKYKGLIELRNHSITLNLKENLVAFIDKAKFEEAISNIIINAIKYTPPGGEINVQIQIDDNQIFISIKDNGIGITENEKVRLFKQFGKIERYGKNMDVLIDGIGLGLYLTKAIVKLHEGKIWVESEGRNKGSKFIISLPITKI